MAGGGAEVIRPLGPDTSPGKSLNSHQFRTLVKLDSDRDWHVPAGDAIFPIGPDTEPAIRVDEFRSLKAPANKRDWQLPAGEAIDAPVIDTSPSMEPLRQVTFRQDDGRTVLVPTK